MEGNKRTFAYRSKEELNYDPFKGMSISSHAPLEGLKRSKCPGCQASRMYFCYKCYLYVETLDVSKIPKVKVSLCFFKYRCFILNCKRNSFLKRKIQGFCLSVINLSSNILFTINHFTNICIKKQRNIYF